MADNIYKYEAKDLSGKTVKLSDYKGKVLMIVNIASQCGQTPQLATLEKLYQKYRSQGFEILAFSLLTSLPTSSRKTGQPSKTSVRPITVPLSKYLLKEM
jgi:glutathione peroxidase-family protein